MAFPESEADLGRDAQPKASLLQKFKRRGDGAMARRGLDGKRRALVWHYLETFWEQVFAIVPISILQVRFAIKVWDNLHAPYTGTDMQRASAPALCFRKQRNVVKDFAVILLAGAGSGHLFSTEQRQPCPAGANEWLLCTRLARLGHVSRAGCRGSALLC